MELRERPSVQVAGGHEVVPGRRAVDDAVEAGGRARAQGQGGSASRHGSEALLEDVVRGVHDAG